METTLLSATDCRHHWLLGQPDAGVVLGECRSCGAGRELPAYLGDRDGESAFRPQQQASAATAVGGARPSPQP